MSDENVAGLAFEGFPLTQIVHEVWVAVIDCNDTWDVTPPKTNTYIAPEN